MNGKDTAFYSMSRSPEHYTPKYILERAREVMGDYYDPTLPGELDGFFKEWKGAVFLNPPYGHDVWRWFGKLRDEVNRGNVHEYIVLWKCAPETKAWRILMAHTMCVAFPQKRLTFTNERGENGSGATFSSALFYYGPSKSAFSNYFYDCSIWEQVSPALEIVDTDTKGNIFRPVKA